MANIFKTVREKIALITTSTKNIEHFDSALAKNNKNFGWFYGPTLAFLGFVFIALNAPAWFCLLYFAVSALCFHSIPHKNKNTETLLSAYKDNQAALNNLFKETQKLDSTQINEWLKKPTFYELQAHYAGVERLLSCLQVSTQNANVLLSRLQFFSRTSIALSITSILVLYHTTTLTSFVWAAIPLGLSIAFIALALKTYKKWSQSLIDHSVKEKTINHMLSQFFTQDSMAVIIKYNNNMLPQKADNYPNYWDKIKYLSNIFNKSTQKELSEDPKNIVSKPKKAKSKYLYAK